jgi:hypothetical protein
MMDLDHYGPSVDLMQVSVRSVSVLPVESFGAFAESGVRLGIMNLLSRGPMTVTAMANSLGMLKGIVHRHVKVLENFGWIRQLSDEEASRLGLSREANRIYYVPTALLYLALRVEQGDDDVLIRILNDHGAFIDSRRRMFILITPTMTVSECGGLCPNREGCLEWARRMGRQLRIEVSEDDVPRALIAVFSKVALREVKIHMVNTSISLTSPRFNAVYMRHVGLMA